MASLGVWLGNRSGMSHHWGGIWAAAFWSMDSISWVRERLLMSPSVRWSMRPATMQCMRCMRSCGVHVSRAFGERYRASREVGGRPSIRER